MIYEFRTYDLVTGKLNYVLEKFGEKIDGRNTVSNIGAFWYTEIGPLNQIIHVWPYENMEHRNSCRKEAVNKGLWPPNTGDCMVNMNTVGKGSTCRRTRAAYTHVFGMYFTAHFLIDHFPHLIYGQICSHVNCSTRH